MSSSHQPTPQSSVTVDRLFAPAPHGLINDPQISYAAFRLWCVLHRLSWIREPPEMDRLCAEMRQQDRTPDRRSVYRWLSELETRGWLRWQRTPGKQSVNRFVVLSERKPVTPESEVSEPVIVGSQPVTPESQPVTLRSQAPPIQPPPEQAKRTTQNHENHEIVVGVGGAPSDLFSELRRRGIGRQKALQITALNCDPATVLTSIDNLYDPTNPKTMGGIINRLIDTPPAKGHPYVRSERSLQSDDAPDRARRHPTAARGKGNPTGGAELKDPGWMDRLIAKAENGEL
jgi:hypothetical protein